MGNSSSTKFKLNESCIFTTLGEKSVVLNIDSGKYYELNASGTLIFELIKQNKSMKEINEFILEDFKIANPEHISDIESFIQECIDLDFIMRPDVE